MRLAVQQRGEDTLAQVALIKPVLKVGRSQVLVEFRLRAEAHPTHPANQTFHLFPGVCAQVSPVVADLAEALPTFGTAVRARSSVQVHVVLELELRGQQEVADSAAVVTLRITLWGKDKKRNVYRLG